MKKNNLILTIAITLIIYFIFIFFFRGLSKTFNLEWTKDTGTLGDTLGGFLSPLIGLAGFYFIYETFKAQHEQLDDQRDANALNKSALLYSDLAQIIDSIISDIKHLVYIRDKDFEGHGITPLEPTTFLGIEALGSFLNMKALDEGLLQDTLRTEDKPFLDSLDLLIGKISYLFDMKQTFSDLLVKDHKTHLEKKIRWMFNGYLNKILPIYSNIRFGLDFKGDNDQQNEDIILNTNYLIRLYANFEDLMSQLVTLKYISEVQVNYGQNEENQGVNWYTEIDEELYSKLCLQTDYSYTEL